jgi:hypothetical protein
MSALTQVWDVLPDLSAWILESRKYVAENLDSVAYFLGMEVLLACGLALLAARVIRGRAAHIASLSVWYRILRDDLPTGCVRTWVWVITENGTEYKGPLRAYTPSESAEDFALALGGSPLQYRTSQSGPWRTASGFDAIVIPGSDVRHFLVSYLDAKGGTLAAQPPSTFPQRARQAVRKVEGSLCGRA